MKSRALAQMRRVCFRGNGAHHRACGLWEKVGVRFEGTLLIRNKDQEVD